MREEVSHALFDGLRTWFRDLSGPKRVVGALVAVAVGVGAVVGAANGSIQLYDSLVKDATSASRLESVDISFIGNRKLDIKLRNVGNSTAFITRADLRVGKIWAFVRPYQCTGGNAYLYGDVSHVYKVKLPVDGAPYDVSENLSQTIEPDAVDRFQIYLQPTKLDADTDTAFLAALTLVYDADEKKLAEDLLFAYPADDQAFSFSPGIRCRFGRYELQRGLEESDAARLSSENEKKIAEVKRIDATENGYVSELVRTVPGH